MLDIGDFIRTEVKRRGISQYAMNKATGVSQGSLSEFLAGKGDIHLKTASKILHFLGIGLTVTQHDTKPKKDV